MDLTMPAGPPPGSSISHDPEPQLALHTGWLDDRRTELSPDSRLYVVFKAAHAKQDSWTDEQHREFWSTHLGLWPGKGGTRANIDALAFMLAAGQLAGFTFKQLINEMPGRSYDELRDRGVIRQAERMLRAMANQDVHELYRRPPVNSGLRQFNRFLLALHRLWRLPRVFALDDRGREESLLPPPLGGWYNLSDDDTRPDPHAFESLSKPSGQALLEASAALHRLRAVRGSS